MNNACGVGRTEKSKMNRKILEVIHSASLTLHRKGMRYKLIQKHSLNIK